MHIALTGDEKTGPATAEYLLLLARRQGCADA